MGATSLSGISIALMDPQSMVAALDMEKLLLKKRVKVVSQVSSYELGHDPQEIGGHIRVSSMRMSLVTFSKKNKK